MASITMNNIVKKYGDGFPAVNDVSIDVADGEFMILVGPSGCGKSTLLRMIVGLEDITSGDMLIGDRRVNDLAPRDRNLAMVFQNYALYPHLSVFENIAFPLRLAGADDKTVRERVLEAANTLELTEHLERKPANLSGGQRQRVAMGRAIVRNADAFLFDEPLSNLDAKLRGQMRTEISRLQKRLGITTVYVTHDQIEAMTLGDRVAVLKRGELQQLATPRELYDNPANLFVGGFIGSPPMNFMPATVEGTTLKLPFGEVQIPPEKARRAAGKGLLIAGVRPENFAEATASRARDVSDTNTFEATVDVVEWLGNETYAYIPFEAPPEVQSQLAQLEKELDGEVVRTQLVVALEGSSRVKSGDHVRIWMDASKVHLFDPQTTENLTVDLANAGQIPARQANGHRTDHAAASTAEGGVGVASEETTGQTTDHAAGTA
jgi:multiple sugar transport system ATP-binding protein